jgi:hypothetical protein
VIKVAQISGADQDRVEEANFVIKVAQISGADQRGIFSRLRWAEKRSAVRR